MGLGILIAVAATLMSGGSSAYRTAHSSAVAARASATIEAAVSRGVLALFDQRPEHRWSADGRENTFEFGGELVKVAIQDELGLIDINQADLPILEGLLRSVGIDQRTTESLATDIVEWRTRASFRDFDEETGPDFESPVGPYRPRHAPFQSVDELLLVRDVTPSLYRSIEPALTVYSGRQFINPDVAPREALRALPGMTPDAVEAIISSRSMARAAGTGSGNGGTSPVQGRAFTIRIEFREPGNAGKYEAKVRLTGNPMQPFWLLDVRAKRNMTSDR